jgi:hypothetical protein
MPSTSVVTHRFVAQQAVKDNDSSSVSNIAAACIRDITKSSTICFSSRNNVVYTRSTQNAYQDAARSLNQKLSSWPSSGARRNYNAPMAVLHILYRISDKSRAFDKDRAKNKLATKIDSLENAVRHLGRDNFHVFADNCDQPTIDKIESLGIAPKIISLGNSGSLCHVIRYALEHFEKEDYVYFLEDDFWHLSSSKSLLLEGLSVSDYVTLYDNPDKYKSLSDGGYNPYITDKGEGSEVFLTLHRHWKTTNSTVMTFATRVGTLKEDANVFISFAQQKIPQDFAIFTLLRKQPLLPLLLRSSKKLFLSAFLYRLKLKPKRTLISPIPSLSTHLETDYLAPFIGWADLIEDEIRNKLSSPR